MTAPATVPYSDAIAAYVESLIADGDALAALIDESQYRDEPGYTRPVNPRALAVDPGAWATWHGAAWNVIRSVTGAEGHPFSRDFMRHAELPCVAHVVHGNGTLRGFLRAWQAGALWFGVDDPIGGVVKTGMPVPGAQP